MADVAVIAACLALATPHASWGQAAPTPQSGVAQPEPPPSAPWEKRGLTATVGAGYGYGPIGLQARFDLPLRWWLHVSPFAGGGTAEGFTTRQLTVAAGVSASVGMRHRLTVDVGAGPYQYQDLNLHGTVVDRRTIYGPVVAAGYELCTAGGFVTRLLFGYTSADWSRGVSPTRAGMTFNFGFGRRIW